MIRISLFEYVQHTHFFEFVRSIHYIISHISYVYTRKLPNYTKDLFSSYFYILAPFKCFSDSFYDIEGHMHPQDYQNNERRLR